MPHRLIIIALLAALAGCGSDSGSSASPAATTAAPATTTPPTAATTAAPTGLTGKGRVRVTAPQKKRLAANGYKVRQSGIEGGGEGLRAGLEAPLPHGGGLTVFAFKTHAQAEAKAARFKPLARKYPRNFQVKVRGTTLYLGVAEGSEHLSPAEFQRAVAAAEGD